MSWYDMNYYSINDFLYCYISVVGCQSCCRTYGNLLKKKLLWNLINTINNATTWIFFVMFSLRLYNNFALDTNLLVSRKHWSRRRKFWIIAKSAKWYGWTTLLTSGDRWRTFFFIILQIQWNYQVQSVYRYYFGMLISVYLANCTLTVHLIAWRECDIHVSFII